MSIYLLKDHLVLSTELIKHNYPLSAPKANVRNVSFRNSLLKPISSQLIKSNYRVMHSFVKCKCGGVTKKAGVSKIYEENVWKKGGARTNFSWNKIDFCLVIYGLFFLFDVLSFNFTGKVYFNGNFLFWRTWKYKCQPFLPKAMNQWTKGVNITH